MPEREVKTVSMTEPTKALGGLDAADEATVNIGAASVRAQADAKAAAEAEAEAQRRVDEARIRQEERAAREKALGTMPATQDDVPIEEPERAPNDRFIPSLGLFVLRLALASLLGLRGAQVMLKSSATTTWLTENNVPQPELVVWVLGIGLLIIAILLLVGFGTRLAGLLTFALGVLVLVFVRWGYEPILQPGQAGYIGDWDVLVAAVGLLLFCLGSGGWAIDAAMRFGRAKRRLYQ